MESPASSRSRSPRREPAESNGEAPPEIELPPLWEPVFPPMEKLMHLDEQRAPESPSFTRHGMPTYTKGDLSPKTRAADGWRQDALRLGNDSDFRL